MNENYFEYYFFSIILLAAVVLYFFRKFYGCGNDVGKKQLFLPILA
jgi:hypothetical protein